jgi:hypothetical protein
METGDFDQRMEKIKTILEDFKSNYFNTETQSIHDTIKLKEVYIRFSLYTEASLKSYLNTCLANETTHCEEDTIKKIVAYNTPMELENNVRVPDVVSLLIKINTYMSPWNPKLNAEVGALFARFIDYPFSINIRAGEKDHVSLY